MDGIRCRGLHPMPEEAPIAPAGSVRLPEGGYPSYAESVKSVVTDFYKEQMRLRDEAHREQMRLKDERIAALEYELSAWEKGHKLWLGDDFGDDIKLLYLHLKEQLAISREHGLLLSTIWDKILSAYMKCEGNPDTVMAAIAECRSIALGKA